MSRHLGTPTQHYSGTPLTIVLTVAILSIFFIGFLSLYFCKCVMQNFVCSWHHRNVANNGPPISNTTTATTTPPPTNPGLDPKIIQSFPTFVYSSVKDYRKEKYGLECAICLIEFDNDDILRLLTFCCHVFHQQCIDLWLESHDTCPVCRRSLDESDTLAAGAGTGGGTEHNTNNSTQQDTITTNNELLDSLPMLEDSFAIKDDDDRNNRGGGSTTTTTTTTDHRRRNSKSTKFSKSHSTGHSIFRNRAGELGDEDEKEIKEDKFTLRLPEHVKAKIIKGHNPTRSCITFGENNKKKGSYKTVKKNGGLLETATASNSGDIDRV